MAEDAGHIGPKYQRIAGDLRERIDSGEFSDGRLPGRDTLREHYGVAINTVEHAIDVLRKEGRVVTEHGSGTFIRTPPEVVSDPERAEILERLEVLKGGMEALRADMDAMQADILELYSRLGYEHRSQRQNGKARHEQAG